MMAMFARPASRPADRPLALLGLAVFGLAGGFALAETSLRLAAPLLPLPIAVFVGEEAHPVAVSALRVARGVHLVLRDEDFRSPVDVLALGDSMVFGSLVEESDLFTTRLAAATGRRVMNLGVGSSGPCAYNHMLQVALSRLPRPPAVVLYTVFANDIVEPPCGPVRDQDLFIWESEYRRSLALRFRWAREWLLQHSAFYQLVKRYLGFGSLLGGASYAPISMGSGSQRFLMAPPEYWRPWLDPSLPSVREGIARTALKAQAGAAPLGPETRFVLVLMPFKEQVHLPVLIEAAAAPPQSDPGFYDTAYDALRDRAASLGIECLDLRAPFREAARQGVHLYWTLDGHLRPEGHRLLAQVLAASFGSVTSSSPAPGERAGSRAR